MPLVYEFTKDMKVKGPGKYLDPQAAAAAGAASVAKQGAKKR
jgi:2,3-bisphosphoglycerate-dependent phosphoglycerate mutase